MVVLDSDHAEKAAEIVFNLISVLDLVPVGLGVVDPFGFPTGMQHVPMAGFVCMHDGQTVDVLLGHFNALRF